MDEDEFEKDWSATWGRFDDRMKSLQQKMDEMTKYDDYKWELERRIMENKERENPFPHSFRIPGTEYDKIVDPILKDLNLQAGIDYKRTTSYGVNFKKKEDHNKFVKAFDEKKSSIESVKNFHKNVQVATDWSFIHAEMNMNVAVRILPNSGKHELLLTELIQFYKGYDIKFDANIFKTYLVVNDHDFAFMEVRVADDGMAARLKFILESKQLAEIVD